MTVAADNVSAGFQQAHHWESHQNEAQQNGSEMLVTEPAACSRQQYFQYRTARGFSLY